MTARLGGALCAALAVWGVGACADGAPPAAEAPPPVVASPSPSASSTRSAEPTTDVAVAPPTLPAEAKEKTPEGAAAFVRHWFELVNYAYETGNVEPLRDASSPECQTCQNTIETIADQYGSGGEFDGGTISLRSVLPSSSDSTGQYAVTVQIDQEPLQRIAADGTPGEISDGENDLLLVAQVRSLSSAWSMTAVSVGS